MAHIDEVLPLKLDQDETQLIRKLRRIRKRRDAINRQVTSEKSIKLLMESLYKEKVN